MRQSQLPARPKRKRSVETLPTSIRLTEELALAIRAEAERTQRPIAWLVREMLEENWKTRRFPGIMFVEGRAGRRAQIAGTGLEIWRIVELLWQGERIPRLTEDQINLARAYARSFPGEITFFREVSKLLPRAPAP